MNIYISLIITMVFSAFFSGMEIAFVSVDKLRFEMERKGGVTSRILSVFFKNPNEFISTMLVGNNMGCDPGGCGFIHRYFYHHAACIDASESCRTESGSY